MKINQRVVIMREAVTKIVRLLTGRGVRVTQQGSKAYVEYVPGSYEVKRVNIPYIPDDASDELLDAVQGFLDHEVAHILYTDPKMIEKAAKAGVAQLFNILEDSFIERKMAANFQGSGANLEKVGKFVLTRYTAPSLAKNPEDAAAILMFVTIRALAGQTVFRDFMSDKWHLMKEVMDKLGPDAEAMVSGIKSSADTLEVAIELKKRLSKKKETPPAAPAEPKKGKEPEHKPVPEPTPDDDDDTDPADPTDKEEGPADEAPGKPDADDEVEPTDKEEDKSDDLSGIKAPDLADAVSDMAKEETPEPEPEHEPDVADDTHSMDDGDDTPADDSGAGDDLDITDDTPKDDSPLDDTPKDDVPIDEEGEGAKSDDMGTDTSGGGDFSDDDDPYGEGKGGDSSAMPDEDGPTMFDELADKGAFSDFDELVGAEITKSMDDAVRGSEYLIFTKDHDRIEPLEIHNIDLVKSSLKSMQAAVDGMVGVMQKDMERIMAARSQVVWTGGHRSGKLHGASLVRVAMSRDDVYRRKQENQSKDVAVEIVVDASGSMRCGNRIQTAAYSAYALLSVLQRMGIAAECVAFTTVPYDRETREKMYEEARGLTDRSEYSRQEAIYMPIIKSFNDMLDSTAKERLVALFQEVRLRENVDGECIQIAAHRLLRRRESRKIMMVLSDGEPWCGDGNIEEQANHLKVVTSDIEKRGMIDLIGIGIETNAVRKFYKHSVVLSSVTELPTEVMKQLKSLMFR